MASAFSNVFGLNRRNRALVSTHNAPRDIGTANDKIATKEALSASGVRVPDQIAAVRSAGEVEGIYALLEKQQDGFVVKPSHGAQGRAVMIFSALSNERAFPLHSAPISKKQFRFLIASIVSGEFTAGRPVDCALVEERLNPDKAWVLPDLPGAPDMRVIVFQGKAVMAMVRLPTIASSGRANLHKGAIGLGIDLESGCTTHGIWNDHSIARHPDTGDEVRGHAVKGLRECLDLAERCAEAIPLGFMGVDLMLDHHKGPCVIEVNARPGLSIQLANRRGLGEVLYGDEPSCFSAAEGRRP